MRSLGLFLVVVSLAATAHAEDVSATASQPTPTPLPAIIRTAGYVETFYQQNFNHPSNLITAYRGFDDRTNSFTLDNAVIDVSAQQGATSARVALQIGHTPATYYLAEPNSPADGGTGASNGQVWQYIQQAYVGYQLPHSIGLAEMGVFLSPIGVEGLAVKDDWNWSRSDLFYGLPFYHAGARVTVPLSQRWTGVFWLVNGWNDIVNKNPYPAGMGVLTFTVPDRLTVNALYMGAIERPTGAAEGQPWRNLADLNATWTVARWLSFAAQADGGFEQNNFGVSSWAAGAAYVQLRPYHALWFAGRADVFREYDARNSAGASTRIFFPSNQLHSETATAEYRPAETFSLRLEYRHDGADVPMFFKGTVQYVAGAGIPTAARQDTVTFGATAWF